MKDVVIVSACRTPIGKFNGALAQVSARELAILAGKEAIRRAGLSPDQVEEIAMGQLYTAMQGSLPARQVSMRIGLPASSNAVSLNQNCASGMRALEVVCNDIALGKTEIALAVGVESMTNAPYLLPKARQGYRMGPGTIEDSMLHDGLVDELSGGHMGVTAENVAKRYGITRQECDELALLSHNRACRAIDEGKFKEEIIPVEIKTKRGVTVVDTDEHPIRGRQPGEHGQAAPRLYQGWRGYRGQRLRHQRRGRRRGGHVPGEGRRAGHSAMARMLYICGEGVEAPRSWAWVRRWPFPNV